MVRFDARTRSPFKLRPQDQWRIGSLIVGLLLVLWLMSEAAGPSRWQWLWNGITTNEHGGDVDQGNPTAGAAASPKDAATSAAPSDPIDTRVRRKTDDAAEPLVRAPLSSGQPPPTPPDVLPGIDIRHLQEIKDDTVFRHSEEQALFQAFEALRNASAEDIAIRRPAKVTFAQLFRQPRYYRGRLVRLEGAIRRAMVVRAPQNELGIKTLCELWLQPVDDPTNPIAIYCLDLPSGFPVGLKVNESVQITGLFFKLWVYNAQDALRSAPLIIARSIEWKRPPQANTSANRGAWRFLGIVCAAALTAAVLLLYVSQRTSGPQRDLASRWRIAAGSPPRSEDVAESLRSALEASQAPLDEPHSRDVQLNDDRSVNERSAIREGSEGP